MRRSPYLPAIGTYPHSDFTPDQIPWIEPNRHGKNRNISNPRGNYPNLKADAPKTAKILVRTSQLVLVNKLGFTVTFSGDIKDEFDRQYNKTVGAGRSIRLFGIPINVGAQGSDTKKDGTHKSAWDASSGTFTVAPDSQISTANVIAVVGEKVQTF